jgi:putative SOS response-associated peptidase YedK
MCGRYAASRRPDDLVQEFEVGDVVFEQDMLPLEADFNVAPTKDVYAVLERRPLGRPEADPVRQLRVVRWGLVPSWAADPSAGSRLINARVETAADRPAYRRALLRRRCLLPADGYYEWYGPAGPSTRRGQQHRQPFFIRPAGGGVLAMAGLYEFWYDASRDRDDPAAWLWTVTVLTTAAEPAVAWLHDRMPLAVPRERYAAWLDPELTDPDGVHALVRSLLGPLPDGALEAYPVSDAVGDVRSNGPHLVVPVPAHGADRNADATLF